MNVQAPISFHSALDDRALDQLFRQARTHNVWLKKQVPEALLRQAVDLARYGCVQLAARSTPANNATVRNVFVIGPDKKVKLILVYPMTTGRNFDEVLRVIDSLQLTANHKVATPVNWKQGEDVVIAGSVTDDAAREIWPDGWESPRPYIRIVPQPS